MVVLNDDFDATLRSLIVKGKYDEVKSQVADQDHLIQRQYEILILLDQMDMQKLRSILELAMDEAQRSTSSIAPDILERFSLYYIFTLHEVSQESKARQLYQEINDKGLSDNDFVIGMNNLIRGNFERNPTHLRASIDPLKRAHEYTMIVLAYSDIAHGYTGNKGLEVLEEARNYLTEIGHANYLTSMKCMTGFFHQTLGDLQTAKKLNTEAYQEAQKSNYRYGLASASNCLGSIAIEEGEIEAAITHLEYSNELYRQHSGVNLGAYAMLEAYRLAGKYQQAQKLAENILDTGMYLPSSLKIREFIQIILLSIDMERLEQGWQYLERMQSLYPKPDSLILAGLRLSEALLLKHSNSLKTTYKSQEILEELLQIDISIYHVRVVIIKHYCELLLVEYEMYESESILQKVEDFVAEMAAIAEKQNLLRLKYEIRLISSRLELIRGNYAKSEQILLELQEFARQNRLDAYEKLLSQELKSLNNNYTKWTELVENNAPMKERIAQAKLREYMVNALKMMDERE